MAKTTSTNSTGARTCGDEACFGGWKNSRSVIRRGKYIPHYHEAQVWRADYRTPIVLLFAMTAESLDGDFPWSEALQRASGDGHLPIVVAERARTT